MLGMARFYAMAGLTALGIGCASAPSPPPPPPPARPAARPSAEPEPPAPATTWVIEQTSNGFPGAQDTAASRQRLTLGEGRLRIDYLDQPRSVIVRLDQGTVLDLDLAGRRYRVTPFQEFRDWRAKRRAKREKEQREVRATRDEALRRQLLRELNLREDGRVIVGARETGDRRDIATHGCRRVEVFENDRTILTLWLADDIDARGLLDVYLKLGLFEDDLAAVLGGIKGLPLAISAQLDFGVAILAVSAEARSIKTEPADPALFELPAGFERYDPASEAPRELPCSRAGCDQRARSDTPHYRRVGGKDHFFCSRRCLEQWERD